MDLSTVCLVVGVMAAVAVLALKTLGKIDEAKKLNKIIESVIVGVEDFSDSELYEGNKLKQIISKVAEGNAVGKDLHNLVERYTESD